jgi:hypothetical protein
MATGKKKTKELSINAASESWPKINQGSHLTVKTFEDGRTELIWDDEALMRDVREAINSYELSQIKSNVKTKTTTRTKKVKSS